MSDDLPEAIQLPWGPDNWDCWTPFELASRLEGINGQWCVVGGWALDLYTGVVHRDHSDLEIVVPRQSFQQVKDQLAHELDFFVAGAEGQWPIASAGAAFDKYQQTFGRDKQSGVFRLDVMRVADAGAWEHANHPEITRPWSETIAVAAGVPFLRPEQVLLYKALGINSQGEPRLKDAEDFLYVLPFLDSAARDWLTAALSSVRPDHTWLRALALSSTR